MSQASVSIRSARVYLNDVLGTTWSDSILMPFLQEAFGELIQDLDLNSIGALKQQTAPILVNAGDLTLGLFQPINILEPISMQERNPGEDANRFTPMLKVNFLPEMDQLENLIYWSFNQETISFLGATRNKEVVLRYKGALTAPRVLTDPIGVIYGERFLGPRIAALAFDAIGRDSSRFTEIADANKYKLIQRNVLADQTPIRRKGYRSGSGRFGPAGSATFAGFANTGSGGDSMSRFADAEIPVGAIDGVNVTYTLARPPNPVLSLVLIYNGQTLEQAIDYTLAGNIITFITAPVTASPGLLCWYRW